MSEPTKDTLFDKRLVERNIRLGLITREEFDKHLKATEDRADQGESIDVGALQDEVQKRYDLRTAESTTSESEVSEVSE